MGRNSNRTMIDAAIKNNSVFIQYVNRLTELSTVMFKWTGLPDEIDTRFLEMTLFRKGACLFFKDDVIGHAALPFVGSGRRTLYNIPETRRAYSVTGYSAEYNSKNSVIIYNNYIKQPSVLDVQVFARRLYDLDCAIDVNAKAQKTPILITCDKTQELTLKNLYEQYDGNAPAIFANKALNKDALSVLATGAPYVADKLFMLKTQIWNEALTYLGISNVSFTKKERLVSDEVVRNQGGTVASRYSRLESRQRAAEQINKMFGLDCWCEYREDYEPKYIMVESEPKEGEDNE